jgi:hypothetical protein
VATSAKISRGNMADVGTASAMTEYIPIGISAIASAVAGGVAGALRFGTRIKELENQIAAAGAWKAEFDKLREESRQSKTAIEASIAAAGRGGGVSSEAVKSMVDAAVATAVAAALHEARQTKVDLDGMRRDLREENSADAKRWSELDRMMGRITHAIETLEKG